jgi:acetyl esterase/lipase
MGGPGDPNAKDEVDRESSDVQCAACFFPAADFLNYSRPGDIAVGVGKMAQFKAGFGPLADTLEGRQKLGREISPIYYVHSNMPPVLIMHGDADKLVPIYQSEMFIKKCKETGVTAKLVVKEGGAHGWPDIVSDLNRFGDWFDQYLLGTKPKQ